MRYVIGIGYVNRMDLLKEAINSIQPLWPQTFIIDNSINRDLQNETSLPEDVQVYRPPVPFTFSQTMNLMHRFGAEQECDIILFMHNDAAAEGDTVVQFLSVIENLQKEERKWGVAFTGYHALVSFNMKAIRETGPWDTVLPHYFSDNDYYRRLYLLGYEHVTTDLKVTHHGSSTVNSDEKLQLINNRTFPLYERYYQIKWGGSPGREHYIRPFNRYSINPVKDYLKVFDSGNLSIKEERKDVPHQ